MVTSSDKAIKRAARGPKQTLRSERLIEVGLQVVFVLEAHAEADQAIRKTNAFAYFLRYGRVGHDRPAPAVRAGVALSQIARYDQIGEGYSLTRREDPYISAAIRSALGDARSVVNVGAGTGSYEPHDRYVIAVEPSDVMAAQRPPTIPPALRASAAAVTGLGTRNMTAAQTAYWENVLRSVVQSNEFKQYAAKNQWDDTFKGSAEMRKFLEQQYAELKSVMGFLGIAK